MEVMDHIEGLNSLLLPREDSLTPAVRRKLDIFRGSVCCSCWHEILLSGHPWWSSVGPLTEPLQEAPVYNSRQLHLGEAVVLGFLGPA